VQIIKYRIKYLDKYGLDTAGIGWVLINNFAWDYVFYHCSDKDTLNKVAGWMKQIIQIHPDDHVCVDTYANLLYKAGRKDEAIEWEEKAVSMEEEAAKKEKREPDPVFQQTLDKMKNGIATWSDK
jgi:vacuolar-type H+-ATPase catalytic subunit A/Vma1